MSVDEEDSKQQMEVDYGDQFEEKKPVGVSMHGAQIAQNSSQGSTTELPMNQEPVSLPGPIQNMPSSSAQEKLSGLSGLGLSIKPPLPDA